MSGNVTNGKIRIAIIDSEHRRLEQVAKLAGELASSHLMPFNCAKQPIEAVQKFQPDIAIVEAQMPDGRGFDCARTIKLIVPRAVIVMLADSALPNEIFQALLAGATGYLARPF